MKYDFAAIEKKWQDKWEQVKPYAAVTGDKRPKFYGLIEFPYPSAAGLHVGHGYLSILMNQQIHRSRRWTSSAAKSACRATMS